MCSGAQMFVHFMCVSLFVYNFVCVEAEEQAEGSTHQGYVY